MTSRLALIQFLQSQEAASLAPVQAALRISQPTASRLLKQLEDEVGMHRLS